MFLLFRSFTRAKNLSWKSLYPYKKKYVQSSPYENYFYEPHSSNKSNSISYNCVLFPNMQFYLQCNLQSINPEYLSGLLWANWAGTLSPILTPSGNSLTLQRFLKLPEAITTIHRGPDLIFATQCNGRVSISRFHKSCPLHSLLGEWNNKAQSGQPCGTPNNRWWKCVEKE